ncbi:MAG: hypothetical protein ACPG7F_13455 [Aggregatilineales bacterium]
MPVKIEWLVEGRVIFVHAAGEFTSTELKTMDDRIIQLLDSSTWKRVHVLSSTGDLTSIPDLETLRTLQYFRHPRLGWTVACGFTSLFRRHSTHLIGRALNLRFRLVKTLEEGAHSLNYVEKDLPDLWALLEGENQTT